MYTTSSTGVLPWQQFTSLYRVTECVVKNVNESDVLVRAVTEAELLRLPLLVVTVTAYRRPEVRTLKVHSLASQDRILWATTVERSACRRTTVKPSHSPSGRLHRTLRVDSSA